MVNGMPVWLSTTILGLGTVFIGLLLLILLTRGMSLVCAGMGNKPKKEKKQPPKASPGTGPEAEDHGAFVAAVSAAIAQSMGVQVSGIRILSIRKIDA